MININAIITFFKQTKFTLFLFIYLLFVAFIPINSANPFLAIAGLISIIVWLKLSSYLPRVLYYLILFFTATIIAFESVYAFGYKILVGYSEIEVVVLTNFSEAKGMMSTIWIVILLSIVASFGLVFASGRELRNYRMSIWVPLGTLVGFGLLSLSNLAFELHKDDKFKLFDLQEGPSFFIYYYIKKTSPTLYSTIYSSALFYKDLKRFERIRNLPKKDVSTLKYVGVDNDSTKYRKIYVILGESMNRSYMSLYGYLKQQTTPFIDSLQTHTKSLTKYNGLSVVNYTNKAVPFILTNSDVDNWYAHHEHKTILELAQNTPYKTFWLSNQAKTDMFNSMAYGSEPVNIGVAADYSYFVPAEFPPNDLDLISYYNKLQANGEGAKNELVFFHMRGSHMPYEEGIDEEDESALPSIEGISQAELSYNQSLHHTDRFIRALYEIIDPKQDLIILLSDHGEEVGVGHFVPNLNKDHYLIPIVYVQNKSDRIISITDRFLFNDDLLSESAMFYIFSSLIGYEIDSTVYEDVREKTRKVINGTLVFDFFNDFE